MFLVLSRCHEQAFALIRGVDDHDDFINQPVVAVSLAGAALGIKVGHPGRHALELIRGSKL